jgi:hypothetical protein
VARFWLCPDSWRRHYLLGERFPPTGAMFLGSRVDEALNYYYRHWLETGERLPLKEVMRFFGRNWKRQLEAENDKLGVAWDQRLDRTTALKLAVRALALAFEELVPRIGEPVAVQRRVEFRLGPVEWTVEGHLDLETQRHEPGSENPVEEIVDYKVKAGSAITAPAAARNPQASLYLAARWLEGRPVFRIRRYCTVTYPGQGFTRRGASFQGGVPSEARLTFRRRARSRSGRRPSAWVSPVPGPRRGVGVLDGLRRGV